MLSQAEAEVAEASKEQAQKGWRKKTFLRSRKETTAFVATQQAHWTEPEPGEKQSPCKEGTRGSLPYIPFLFLFCCPVDPGFLLHFSNFSTLGYALTESGWNVYKPCGSPLFKEKAQKCTS